MPIALSQDAIFVALDLTTDATLNHYAVRCPRCRKTNRVSVDQLKRAAPGWQRDRQEEAE